MRFFIGSWLVLIGTRLQRMGYRMMPRPTPAPAPEPAPKKPARRGRPPKGKK